jgi:hypothetical protein
MSVWSKEVEEDISEEEEVDKKNEYGAKVWDNMLEGNLERNYRTAYEDQNYYEEIPDNPEAWVVIYRFHNWQYYQNVYNTDSYLAFITQIQMSVYPQ